MSTSHRPEQFAATLSRGVTQILSRGLSDPRLENTLLTVTGTRVTPDLKTAFIGVSVLPEKAQVRAIAALKHAAAHIRRELQNHIRAQRLPEIVFELDTSLKKQAGVLAALQQVAAEREARGGTSPPAVAEPLGAPDDGGPHPGPGALPTSTADAAMNASPVRARKTRPRSPKADTGK